MIVGSLSRHGLPRPLVGAATADGRACTSRRSLDDGSSDSVKAGRIEIVAAVDGFDGDEVLLADGSRVRPDAVIAATGYRRGLEPLVGHLEVLDEQRVTPLVTGGRSAHLLAPGLFFYRLPHRASGSDAA